MNEDSTTTTEKPRKTRLRGRPRVPGMLAVRLGKELRKSRNRLGLDLSEVAKRAETTRKRLAEIEDGAATATISTIETIAEQVELDWSAILVPFTDASDVPSSTTESEAGRGGA
jgi:transcriptional regulator with XRE-family HTH domain